MTALPQRLRAQARQCAAHGSDLTAALLVGAADDFEDGGPCRDLLGPHADDPTGSVLSLRFAGALHRLVLERRAPELALFYPSVGGTAPPAAVWPVALRAVREHGEELAAGLLRPVQTNEVGRSAVLFGALLQLGRPVRLLEIGASAGLNLLVDRFGYDVADGVLLGDPDSAVRLHRPWQGPHPPYGQLHIVERTGCDPAPLAATSPADRLTLTSYVWADQVARFSRLRAALQIAAAHPPRVEPLPASDFLERELATPTPGVVTVVWHSVVWQYLSPTERATVGRVLAEAGRRATQQAPLVHLSLEPEGLAPPASRFLVERTSWPGGQRQLLAECQGHGPPVLWA